MPIPTITTTTRYGRQVRQTVHDPFGLMASARVIREAEERGKENTVNLLDDSDPDDSEDPGTQDSMSSFLEQDTVSETPTDLMIDDDDSDTIMELPLDPPPRESVFDALNRALATAQRIEERK